MNRFESAEVPFITVGNWRALTEMQLAENPHLAKFVRRFICCFEYDPTQQLWLFIEADRP